MLPNFEDAFETIATYRYSITIGILMLYFTPYIFPVGWATVSITWHYATAAMFFLSIGMILVRDAWPALKQLLGLGVDRARVSEGILRACKQKGGEPPFKLHLSDVEEDNEGVQQLIDDYLAHDECRIEDENVLVVTNKGLQKLKKELQHM